MVREIGDPPLHPASSSVQRSKSRSDGAVELRYDVNQARRLHIAGAVEGVVVAETRGRALDQGLALNSSTSSNE